MDEVTSAYCVVDEVTSPYCVFRFGASLGLATSSTTPTLDYLPVSKLGLDESLAGIRYRCWISSAMEKAISIACS